MKRNYLKLALFLMLLLLVASFGCAKKETVPETTATPEVIATPEPTATPEPVREDFCLSWISDTQSIIYYDHLEGTLTKMTDYILSQKDDRNMLGVIHTGDIVEDCFIEKQWEEPEDMIDRFKEAGLEFMPCAGNHDTGNSEKMTYKYYLERPWLKNYDEDRLFEGGKCISWYFEYNGKKFIVLSVGWFVPWKNKEGIQWMKDQLNAHPDAMGIICVHSYLHRYRKVLTDQQLLKDGKRITWEVLPECKNVKLVLCGHVRGSMRGVQEFDDDGDGTPDRQVHVLRQDSQGSWKKKLGFMRFLTFHTEDGSLEVSTYSPITGKNYVPTESIEANNFTIENLF